MEAAPSERIVRIALLGSIPIERNVLARRLCGEDDDWRQERLDLPAPRPALLVERHAYKYAQSAEEAIWVCLADVDAHALRSSPDYTASVMMGDVNVVAFFVPALSPDEGTLEDVGRQAARVRELCGRGAARMLIVRVADDGDDAAEASEPTRARWADAAEALGADLLPDVLMYAADAPSALRRKLFAPVVSQAVSAGARAGGPAAGGDAAWRRQPALLALSAVLESEPTREGPARPQRGEAAADAADAVMATLRRVQDLLARCAEARRRAEARGEGAYAALARAAFAQLVGEADALRAQAEAAHDAAQDGRDVREEALLVAEELARCEAELVACERLQRSAGEQG